jgi:AraC family transcriptional regulator, regulatory protein of adaptative response / DNA-3-methyladenine glycosylase II
LADLAGRLAAGTIGLDAGADRDEAERQLLAVDGIGPWTAGYVRMRALGDPDVFLPADPGVRQALIRLGHPGAPDAAREIARRWRPWRSYAVQHLQAACGDDEFGRPDHAS